MPLSIVVKAQAQPFMLGEILRRASAIQCQLPHLPHSRQEHICQLLNQSRILISHNMPPSMRLPRFLNDGRVCACAPLFV